MAAHAMAEQRLFVANDLDAAREVTLSHAQTHYLLHVLRLTEGACLLVFDGSNGEWRAQITHAKKSGCAIRLIEKVREQTAAQDIHYAFAPLKQGRLDYMVQKAVEMGASRLQPVLTRFTQVARVNVERMRANVTEAAEQCGILSLAEVAEPMPLQRFLGERDPQRLLIFCDETAAVADPLQALRKAPSGSQGVDVLIGPEGGFAGEEHAILGRQPQILTLSLGPRILRADTAGVAALALVQAALGDWSGSQTASKGPKGER